MSEEKENGIPEGASIRDVPGYDDRYFVCEDGHIWRRARQWFSGEGGRIKHSSQTVKLSVRETRAGYVMVRLTDGHERVTRLLHRIVALAWHGAPPSMESQVNHVNGIKSDNRPANLRWETRSGNSRHAWIIYKRFSVQIRTARRAASGAVEALHGLFVTLEPRTMPANDESWLTTEDFGRLYENRTVYLYKR